MRNDFPKSERLCLRTAVSRLFAEGTSFMAYPYRVVSRVLPDGEVQPAAVAVMTVAPKRRFRHAVTRNRVKRITREAYRQQKQPLVEAVRAAGCRLAVAFLCVADVEPTYEQARRAVSKSIAKLCASLPAVS